MMTRARSHAAVSDIERGKTRVSIEDLADIARLLDAPELLDLRWMMAADD